MLSALSLKLETNQLGVCYIYQDIHEENSKTVDRDSIFVIPMIYTDSKMILFCNSWRLFRNQIII